MAWPRRISDDETNWVGVGRGDEKVHTLTKENLKIKILLDVMRILKSKVTYVVEWHLALAWIRLRSHLFVIFIYEYHFWAGGNVLNKF